MSRIKKVFDKLRDQNKKALIPFLIAGDPSLEITIDLIHRMVEAGADLVELGIPFSDPIADGKTIQTSSQRALQNGFNAEKIFDLLQRLNPKGTPIILMSYYNPIFRFGLKRFAEKCKQCGVDGVIISDLPPEEAQPWIKEARRLSIDTIFLASPTTPVSRIGYISNLTRGFLYYIQFTGVTGMRENLSSHIEDRIRRIKSMTKKPVAVGFGISNPEQARAVSRFSDGIIVGSAIIKIIEENLYQPNLIKKVGDFVSSISSVLKG